MIKTFITKILVWQARAYRARYQPRIVGITGSVGKSSTKEAIATVLEARYRVRKSKKSYNSELGLALAVLGLETAWHSAWGWIRNIATGFKELISDDAPNMLVLEMGVDRPRDMDILLGIVRPDVAVVTAIGEIPVHVEFFSGAEEVAREKSKIIRALSSQGYAILNADDDAVWSMKEKTTAHVLSYGFGAGASMVASNYKISPEGISFKVDYEGASVPVRLPGVYGKHHVYPALAALLVGSLYSMNLIEMAEALFRYQSPPGRLKRIDGIKESMILDDSYNASPLAMYAALDVLLELPATRKIAVIGDMLELGRHTILAHQAVGERVAKIADFVIAVGPRSKFAADEAVAHGMNKENVKNFSTSAEATEHIKSIIQSGDLILVKGSQGMRMELIVEEIMAHPEDASKLLCRQDEFWKSKK